MPIYEYRCTRCGHQFEVVHAVGGTVDRCERCGASVRRVFFPVGIIFKGPGFHVTDYRKSPAPAAGDGQASSDGKGTEGKGGDGKAADGKGADRKATDSKAAGGGVASAKGDRATDSKTASGAGAGNTSS